MSYFDEVYLKRMNQHGKTRQERVQYKKQKEFDDLFLKQTQYLGYVTEINQEPVSQFKCSVQPNKWNESQNISNVLISLDNEPLKTGDILNIHQEIGKEVYDRLWLIIHATKNITQGYRSYKVTELDSEISINDEYGNTMYKIPTKFTTALEVMLVDYYSTKNTMYREPNRDRKILTRDFGFFKKDMYFEFKKKGFVITGIDDISVDGVAVLSIQEWLKDNPEPVQSQDILVGEQDNFFLNNV